MARNARIWDDLTIFSDSQQTVRLVDPTKGTPLHVLAARARAELRALRRDKPGLEIRVVWCPGHTGATGNGLADEEAKAVAHDKDYGDIVPGSYRKNLPIPLDPDHFRKGMVNKYREQANEYWLRSAAGVKHVARLRRVEAPNFLDLVAGLPRRNAVVLYRLVNPATINAYIHG